MLAWLRTAWCGFYHGHQFFIDDLKRTSPDNVICPCARCHKVFTAPYGLAITARWERR